MEENVSDIRDVNFEASSEETKEERYKRAAGELSNILIVIGIIIICYFAFKVMWGKGINAETLTGVFK